MSIEPSNPVPKSAVRWFRFSLGNLFALTLGIVIGFTPSRLHEAFAPAKPHIQMEMTIGEISDENLKKMKLDPGSQENGCRVADSEFLQNWETARKAALLNIISAPTIISLTGQRAHFSYGHEVARYDEKQNLIGTGAVCTEIGLQASLLKNGRIRTEFNVGFSHEDIGTPYESTGFVFESADGEAVVFSHEKQEANGKRHLLIVAKLKSAK